MTSRQPQREPHAGRNRTVAVAATLVFHAAVLVALLLLYLDYPGHEQAQREWPPVDSSELLLGGEYVMTGDLGAEPQPQPEPAAETAPETEAALSPTPPPEPVMASEQPSPAKVVKPEKAKPQEKKKEEKKPAEKPQVTPAKSSADERDAARRREIQAKMGSAFGSASKNAAGSPDGNASTGAVTGAPGHNLKGRTLEHFELPPRGPLGSVSVRITVDRSGRVTSATYAGGSGQASATSASRSNCVAAARRARFSAQPEAPASQTGTITFRFH